MYSVVPPGYKKIILLISLGSIGIHEKHTFQINTVGKITFILFYFILQSMYLNVLLKSTKHLLITQSKAIELSTFNHQFKKY